MPLVSAAMRLIVLRSVSSDDIVPSFIHEEHKVILRHWDRDETDAILQTALSNAFLLNENLLISMKFSLKVIPKGPIKNIPALVQIMAWRRPDDKPLSEA